ncbi:type II toxin-antitoxin system RelE/ParE family toxin [Bacillaceae bacterium W0354]
MAESKYSIHFTPIAMKDLDEVYCYISEELFADNAAADLLKRIEDHIMTLSLFPYSGSHLTDEYLRSKGYRKIVVDSYIVFYIVNERTKQVVIMRILYGKRLYEGLL